MNKVILMGRLTKDPEVRMSQSSNLEISRFTLACNGERANQNGERETQFINCVAFGMTANTINRFLTKGRQVLAQGRIRNSSYEAQDGTRRYSTDVVIDNFEFVGSRNSETNNQTNNFGGIVENNNDNVATDFVEDPYKDFGNEVNLSSDDLPF